MIYLLYGVLAGLVAGVLIQKTSAEKLLKSKNADLSNKFENKILPIETEVEKKINQVTSVEDEKTEKEISIICIIYRC